jgi:hypothetical protein
MTTQGVQVREIESRDTSDEQRDTEPVRLGELLPEVLDDVKKRIESIIKA